jgi:predicted RND superfamily exporter protein
MSFDVLEPMAFLTVTPIMFFKYRKPIIVFFLLWTVLSGFFVTRIQFAFDFEQFFPQGDEDLEFFKSFIEEFETDDNFLLIAVENKPDVFDSSFLNQFHEFCLKLREVPFVTGVQSLTMARSPVKTPFGVSSIPVIHRNQPLRYDEDKEAILSDPRFLYNLINEDATALVAFVKNKDTIDLADSRLMMEKVHEINKESGFKNIHMLGRADLQVEVVKMQQIEILRTGALSFLLVTIVLFFLFRRIPGVLVSLLSIGMALVIFVGLMAMIGREFNVLSALYPILLLIVGTSDVIHIKSKYIDELRKGKDNLSAMTVTVKEIGLATLLTSSTTAIGFATLLTSRVQPVQEFGVNSAIAVIIAYVVVIFFTTSVLSYLPRNYVTSGVNDTSYWDRVLLKTYNYTLFNPRNIVFTSIGVLGILFWGISMVGTNYKIEKNLPKNARVTNDFIYFEKEFAGFRPFEYAVFAQDTFLADSYEVMKEMSKIDSILLSQPDIKGTTSMVTYYKSLERMKKGNQLSAYTFPERKKDFLASQSLLSKSKSQGQLVLISKDNKKARISSRIADLGADSIKIVSAELDNNILNVIDTSVIKIRRTGTGVILDKNSIYIRDNLLQGLVIAIVAVSLLMALLFRSYRMLFIALVPNIFPLLLAGAIIGFAGIELEAGVSVVFAIIFGIAVDDTIHFLSKYKLALNAGNTSEEALKITFSETGKAIIFTTVILFFGFMVMVFSNHQPSVTIGLLIASTLIGAVICDLTLLPVLIRKYL